MNFVIRMLSKKELEYIKQPEEFTYNHKKKYVAQIRYRIRKKIKLFWEHLYLVLKADVKWTELYKKYEDLVKAGVLSKIRFPKNVYDPLFLGKDLPHGYPLDMCSMCELYDFIRKIEKEGFFDYHELF